MTEGLRPEDDSEGETSVAYGVGRTRSPRIAAPDVYAAADVLLLGGDRPTIDRVRMRLGRGSPNTIQEHLEVWWTKLGSRLRDIPGRQFPELPDEVAFALQGLWNTALDRAYATIDGKAATREVELAARELALAAREARFVEQTEAAAARGVALEESLALAREQLTATNTRADRLETLLQAREAEAERLRTRADAVEAEARELRSKLDAATDAHQAERAKLDERHAANEARWLIEVDRARQAAKEAAKDHERQLKALRVQITQLQSQRDALRKELQVARAERRASMSREAQREKQLAALQSGSAKAAGIPAQKRKKPSRRTTPTPRPPSPAGQRQS